MSKTCRQYLNIIFYLSLEISWKTADCLTREVFALGGNFVEPETDNAETSVGEVEALPNLDYKIMQGNSLLEEFEGIKLFNEKLLEAPVINASMFEADNQMILKLQSELLQKYYIKNPEWLRNKMADRPEEVRRLEKQLYDLMKKKKKVANDGYEQKDLFADVAPSTQIRDELEKLHKRFFGETNGAKKKDLKERIKRLEWELIETTLKEQNKVSALKKLEDFKRSNTKPFFLWKLNFAEVFEEKGGFDVVIANPPYVGEKGHKGMFREIKNGALGKFYQGKMDLFYFFFHLALNIGNDASQTSFITTNYYLTASGGRRLREDFRSRAIVKQLINFNELKIFESAKGQHNVITLLSKGQNESLVARTCITSQIGVATPVILESIVSRQDEETDYFDVAQRDLYDGEENYIRLAGTSSERNPLQFLLNRVKKSGDLLQTLCNINTGIMGGCDYINKSNIEYCTLSQRSNGDIRIGDGVFVLDVTNSRDEKAYDAIHDSQYVVKFFKNSDIGRYYTNSSTNKYIIFSSRENDASLEGVVKEHINKFKPILLKIREINNEKLTDYRFLRRGTSHQEIFTSPKIVTPYRSPINSFGYNEVPWYARTDVYYISEKDTSISLKYILALLNSKLYYLWFYHRGKRKGNLLEILQKTLSETPIKKISESDQMPFVEVVDKILAITNSGDYLTNAENRAKVRDLALHIDRLVYKLYDLTPEEIEIVENSSEK